MPYTKKFQKGISLYLGIVVLSVILSIVFGLTAILLNQIKMMREMGYSVTAFFAAETGVERVLKVIIADEDTPTSPSSGPDHEGYSYWETLGNEASYDVKIVCCKASECELGFSCPTGFEHDDNCLATRFCVRSVGTFQGIQRAVEAKIYPTEEGF
jgi:hypothetical protein